MRVLDDQIQHKVELVEFVEEWLRYGRNLFDQNLCIAKRLAIENIEIIEKLEL